VTRGSIPPFDLYEELEVSRQATPSVIEAAHRALVKRYHPDVSTSADLEKITRLNIARDWLLDPVRRARYDGGPNRASAAGASHGSYAAAGTGAATASARSMPRERRAGAPPADNARPARPSSAASFGVHSREVRRFLAELRELDGARTRRVLDARAALSSVAYSEARDASLTASRPARNEAWGFARDAASVIAKGKVADPAAGAIVASVAADIAGAIVVRDLITQEQLELLRAPWTRSGALLAASDARADRQAGSNGPTQPSGPGRVSEAGGMSGLSRMSRVSQVSRVSRAGRGARAGRVAGAPLALTASGVLARRPQLLAITAAGLAILVAVALFASGRKPEAAVAGLTSGPSSGAVAPGGTQATFATGPFIPGGSTDPSATLPPGGSGAPGSSLSPTAATPGRSGPVIGPTSAPTPRPTASAANPTSTPIPTAVPTPSPIPTPVPTPTPDPTPTPSPRVICRVVSLIGVNTSNAQVAWNTAEFTGTVLFAPAPPPQYKIGWQSLEVGTDVPCTSDITVQQTPP
jgi:hypothetical protein